MYKIKSNLILKSDQIEKLNYGSKISSGLEQHKPFERRICYQYIYFDYDSTGDKNLSDQKAFYDGKLHHISERFKIKERIAILKVFEDSTMTKIKFLEAMVINLGRFNCLLNERKELKELELYKLDQKQTEKLRKLINDDINQAINEKSTRRMVKKICYF